MAGSPLGLRPMGRMSMNMVIHGAVRRDLDRFVAALDAFPVGDQRRADELQVAWTHFAGQLHHHHTAEHENAWPALAQLGVSIDTLTTMDAEHEAMSQAVTTAGEALSALVHSPGDRQAAHAHAALLRLREVTGAHLDHEEAETEPLFQEHHDHPAIVEMSRRFRKEVGPVDGGRFFTWLLDGASPEQRAAIEESVPAPALKVLTGVFGRGYRRTVAPVWSH